MGFLDTLKGAISDAGSTVAKKSKEASDTMKINSAIKQDEKKIKDAYYQIGQKYVELHAEDPEEGIAELMEIIKQAQAEIEENKKKLDELKAKNVCPSCGAKVAEGNKFCPACGATLVTEEAVEEAAEVAEEAVEKAAEVAEEVKTEE